MPTANQPFLFFIKLPELKNLLTIHMYIRSIDEPSQRSLFHLQTLKCREFIFMEKRCLASPVKFDMSHIMVIMPKSAIDSMEFKEYTRKLGLVVVEIKDTTPSALQECLQYTCMAKLAPEWNVLKDFLVEGPGFLESNGPLNSVKMDIFVSNNEISLCLQPSCIKLSPTRMAFYATAEQLVKSSTIPITEKCIVFPSLKTAHLLSISKRPRLSGNFKTYSDFQEHWKHMYGYLLPSIPEQNIWYFNVAFRIPNATSYTYPQFCVRPHGPTELRRVDPRPILSAFIKSFCKKVGNVCGEKCRIVEGRASFPEIELYPAVDVSEDMKPRPGTTYVIKPNVSYRKNPPKINTFFDKSAQSNTINEKNNKDTNSNCVGNHAPLLASSAPLNFKNTMNERAQNNLNKVLSMPNLEKKLSQASTSQETQKIIPKESTGFKNVSSSTAPSVSTVNTLETPGKKYAPCFKPSKPKIKPKPLESVQAPPNVYVPQFFPKKKVINSASKEQTKQDSSICKIQTTGTKSKITVKSRKDPVQVNTILSNFNVKKKIPEEKKSAKAAKGPVSKKRQMPASSSSDEIKVKLTKKTKA